VTPLPGRFAEAAFNEFAEAIPPTTPFSAAVLASTLRSTNLGSAVAARMPKITITMISSINVKPDCFFISTLLKFEAVPGPLRAAALPSLSALPPCP
jgi:hypothetical protein